MQTTVYRHYLASLALTSGMSKKTLLADEMIEWIDPVMSNKHYQSNASITSESGGLLRRLCQSKYMLSMSAWTGRLNDMA